MISSTEPSQKLDFSLKALMSLAWPIVVSMLSVATMTLTSMLFVSRLGSAAIAAVGLGGISLFSLWCFPLGLLRAVKILISRAEGAGDRSQFALYTAAALQIAGVLGLGVMALGWCAANWLPLVTETRASGELAATFLNIRLWSTLPLLALIVIQEVRQGQGDSRTAMFTTLAGNLTNILLDYLFVIRWDWGVPGAAWAATIAVTLEFFALLAVHLRGNHILQAGASLGWLRLKGERREILTLGVPSGVQFGLEVGSFGILVLLLSSFSEKHAAAHQIAIQVLHFCFLPAVAFGEAGSVLVGQAHGAGRADLLWAISKRTLGLALSYALLCGLALVFGRGLIVGAFSPEPEVKHLALQLFLLIPVFQIIDAVSIVGRALLRGAGDVRFVAIAGILSAWVCTPPMTYWLGHRLGYGVYGAWLGLSLEVLLVTLILWWRLVKTAARLVPQSEGLAGAQAPTLFAPTAEP
jgi:multidrug resistance protein, MATE family